MRHLPWKDKALPVIKNLAVSKEVKAGVCEGEGV